MSKKTLSDVEITAGLKITSGTPGAGKVLTSDIDGDATWETPASGGTDASALVTGTLDDARLSANVPLLDVINTFTARKLGVEGSFAGLSSEVFSQNDATDGEAAVQAVTTGPVIELHAYGGDVAGKENITELNAFAEDSLDIVPSSGIVRVFGASFKLPNYGAGVLTSDGSGNITSVSGGSGVSESLAIAYAVAL